MSAAAWIEVGLVVAHFGGLVAICLRDPAGLLDAKHGVE